MQLSSRARRAIAYIVAFASPGPSFSIPPVPTSAVRAAPEQFFEFGPGRYRAAHANRPTPSRGSRRRSRRGRSGGGLAVRFGRVEAA